MNTLMILAAATGEQAETITSQPISTETSTKVPADSNLPAQQSKPMFGLEQIALMGLMLVIFYFLLFRGPKKKQQEQIKMVKSLQKNDKVQTIGGIIGTVVDVTDDIVTLKIDEANNTKIKVTVQAIGRNMSKDQK